MKKVLWITIVLILLFCPPAVAKKAITEKGKNNIESIFDPEIGATITIYQRPSDGRWFVIEETPLKKTHRIGGATYEPKLWDIVGEIPDHDHPQELQIDDAGKVKKKVDLIPIQ